MYASCLLHLSVNAIVAQLNSYPFGVNTTIDLNNITTASGSTDIWQYWHLAVLASSSTGIWRGVFRLRSVPALSDVVDICF
jgi:hypothetical protein